MWNINILWCDGWVRPSVWITVWVDLGSRGLTSDCSF